MAGTLVLHSEREFVVNTVLTRCAALCNQQKFHSFMIILPTSRWARDFREKLLKITSCGALSAPYILGYNRAIEVLSTRLSDTQHQGISRHIQLLAGYAILKRFVDSGSAAGTAISDIPIAPLVDSLLGLVSKIKNAGIDPRQLSHLLGKKKNIDRDYKIALLVDFFQQYELFKSQMGYADQADRLKSVLATLEKQDTRFPEVFPELEFLAVIGFDLITRKDAELFSALSGTVPEMIFSLDYDPERPWIFEHIGDIIESLSRHFTPVTQSHDMKKIYSDSPGKKISSLFFKSPDKITIARRIEEPFLNIIAAKDPDDEIDIICRWIKLLLRDNPMQDPEKVCICFPRIEDYLPTVRNTFGRYGIP